MKNTYTIKNLIALLWSKIWIIIIVTTLCGFGSFFVSSFVINPRYEAYTTMYVKNNNSSVGQTSANANVDLNDLNTAKSLASTYITVLKSSSVMEQVSIKLTERYEITDLTCIFDVKNEKLSTKSLKEAFTISAVDETEVIKITANAMVMKDSISGILLVLKYGATTYEDVSNCMKQIELAQANMFGFVLNQIHHNHSGSYYNYKYKYKYCYGSYGYGYKQDSEESGSSIIN